MSAEDIIWMLVYIIVIIASVLIMVMAGVV